MSADPFPARAQPRIPVLPDPGALGLGCWAIGGAFDSPQGSPWGWGHTDDAESIRAICRALDLGVRLFDTADVYGAGHSERILGRALAGRRHEVVIATKFGNTFAEATRRATGEDASPGYVRRACEASLRRLGTDYLDVYLLHLSDHDPAAAVEVREVLEDLVTEGKVRSYGWSTDDPGRARVFAQGRHCAFVEHAMNVLQDSPGMLAVCEEDHLLGLIRSPLAMGLLSGRFDAGSRLASDDIRGVAPAWLTWFRDGSPAPEWLARVEAIRQVLTSGGRSPAAGALAWIWARSPWSIPIPGFRTVAQVEQNVAALGHGPLTEAQMAEVSGLLASPP